jgi:hypothetical protein
VCMGIITSGTISFYVILLYMPTFARTQLHLPLDEAFIAARFSFFPTVSHGCQNISPWRHLGMIRSAGVAGSCGPVSRPGAGQRSHGDRRCYSG